MIWTSRLGKNIETKVKYIGGGGYEFTNAYEGDYEYFEGKPIKINSEKATAYKGKHYFGQEEPTQKVKEENMSPWPIYVPRLPLTFSMFNFNDRD